MIPSNCVEELLLELELWKVSVQIHEIEDDILLDELDKLLELEGGERAFQVRQYRYAIPRREGLY